MATRRDGYRGSDRTSVSFEAIGRVERQVETQPIGGRSACAIGRVLGVDVDLAVLVVVGPHR
jgi:hypothetical protein